MAGSVQQLKLRYANKGAAQQEVNESDVGTLTIDGDLEFQEGAALHIDIRGAVVGQYDVLHVTGDVTLAGILVVNLIDGFAPPNGLELAILNVEGRKEGNFADVRITGLPTESRALAEFRDGRLVIQSTDALLPGVGPCGAGLCGVGGLGVVSLSFTGLAVLRRTRILHRSP